MTRGSTSHGEPSQNGDVTSKLQTKDARELTSLSGHCDTWKHTQKERIVQNSTPSENSIRRSVASTGASRSNDGEVSSVVWSIKETSTKHSGFWKAGRESPYFWRSDRSHIYEDKVTKYSQSDHVLHRCVQMENHSRRRSCTTTCAAHMRQGAESVPAESVPAVQDFASGWHPRKGREVPSPRRRPKRTNHRGH